jgi:hypothetical protein
VGTHVRPLALVSEAGVDGDELVASLLEPGDDIGKDLADGYGRVAKGSDASSSGQGNRRIDRTAVEG